MALQKEMVAAGVWGAQAEAVNGGSVVSGLTASATQTQAAGTALTAAVNLVATCATAGNALTLPVAARGDEVIVHNGGAASANVFPPVGGSINGGTANAALALAAGKAAVYKYTSNVNCIAVISA